MTSPFDREVILDEKGGLADEDGSMRYLGMEEGTSHFRESDRFQ